MRPARRFSRRGDGAESVDRLRDSLDPGELRDLLGHGRDAARR
jgi:hypothetical protein